MTGTAGVRPAPVDGPEVEPAARARLSVADLSVGYGDRTVVRGVSFTAEAGQWLTLIGPNGAGKSSVLKAVVGVVGHGGDVAVDGRSLPGRSGRSGRSRRIAYVPQQPVLPPGMTTSEYVLLGRTAHLSWFGSESRTDRASVARVLERLDLVELAGRPVTSLSGGEAQRASVARAIVQEADIVLLDEPTSALDLAHQLSVLELIDHLRRTDGLAVVTAMHDLSLASRFATSLVLLADGTMVASGRPETVLDPEVLSAHFGVPVSVMEGPDGGAVIVPLRPSNQAPVPSPGVPTNSPRPDPSQR